MLEAIKLTDHINQYMNYNNSSYNKIFETEKNEESTLSELNNSNINNNDKTVKKEEKSLLDSNNAYYIDLTYGSIIKNFQLVNHLQSEIKRIFQENLVFPYLAMKDIEKMCSYMVKDL